LIANDLIFLTKKDEKRYRPNAIFVIYSFHRSNSSVRLQSMRENERGLLNHPARKNSHSIGRRLARPRRSPCC